MRDVSERKRADELQREKEAAEQAKSRFLSNISHELRTPMNAIMGMTSLVAQTKLNPTQKNYIDIVQNSAKSLLALINDILDLSSLDTGHVALKRANFHLEDLMVDIARRIDAEADAKGVELTVEVDDKAPSVLVGDALHLEQVLLSLGGNAIKFNKSDGKAWVKAELAEEDETSVLMHFSVRDTGIGIAPGQMDKLFHRFTQIDDSCTRRFGGAGNGLAIAKKLAEMMGGSIWVESEYGIGSTFHFTARLKKQGNSNTCPHQVPTGVS